MAQLSLFSSDARPAGLGDLAGLLCGPGRISRFGAGDTARLSVVVPDESRVAELRAEAAARSVPLEVGVAPCGSPELRTTYRRDLAELAAAWIGPDGRKSVPPDLQLDGTLLRLWTLAGGLPDGRGGFLLLLDPDAPWTHERLIAACTRVGLSPARAGYPTCGGTRPCGRHGTEVAAVGLTLPAGIEAAPGGVAAIGAGSSGPPDEPVPVRRAGRDGPADGRAHRGRESGPPAGSEWPDDPWPDSDWPIDEDEPAAVIGGGSPARRTPAGASPGIVPRPGTQPYTEPRTEPRTEPHGEPGGSERGGGDPGSAHVPDLDGAGVPPPAPRECRVSGPALRIGGARRLQRLVELVGAPPGCVPASEWPRYWGRNVA
ncbi:MAG: hypothetical protein OJJ54_13330 [Pseudonocardia sp.]|nr:hypothetical protein [Pseudonocardia sp.]